jgi:hypothetical protein
MREAGGREWRSKVRLTGRPARPVSGIAMDQYGVRRPRYLCEECKMMVRQRLPTQVLSPDLSGAASLFFIIGIEADGASSWECRNDGLTFDLEIDEAAAARWPTTSPWLGIRQAVSDQ